MIDGALDGTNLPTVSDFSGHSLVNVIKEKGFRDRKSPVFFRCRRQPRLAPHPSATGYSSSRARIRSSNALIFRRVSGSLKTIPMARRYSR